MKKLWSNKEYICLAVGFFLFLQSSKNGIYGLTSVPLLVYGTLECLLIFKHPKLKETGKRVSAIVTKARASLDPDRGIQFHLNCEYTNPITNKMRKFYGEVILKKGDYLLEEHVLSSWNFKEINKIIQEKIIGTSIDVYIDPNSKKYYVDIPSDWITRG